LIIYRALHKIGTVGLDGWPVTTLVPFSSDRVSTLIRLEYRSISSDARGTHKVCFVSASRLIRWSYLRRSPHVGFRWPAQHGSQSVMLQRSFSCYVYYW